MNDKTADLAALVASRQGEVLFRPSSIDRLLACYGSVRLSATVPPKESSSRYAEEGSAAHIVAQQALRGERQPLEWTDRMVRLDDKGMSGWFVDEEMATGVQSYLDVMRSRLPSVSGTLTDSGWFRFGDGDVWMGVEQRLSLSNLDPTDPFLAQNAGTADCVILDYKNLKITIGDLKYGRGVMVPGDTPQLRDYALMALVTYRAPPGQAWQQIETIVVQPRSSDEYQRVKSAVYTPEALWQFLSELYQAMQGALEPDPPLKPGEKQCRWCAAKAICPALRLEAETLARDAFASVPLMTTTSPAKRTTIPALPDARGLSPDDVATILDRRSLYSTFLEAVERTAVDMLRSGGRVPGYKLVPRTGNRRWTDDAAAKKGLKKLGLRDVDMLTEPELKSPSQMEKAFKSRNPLADKKQVAAAVNQFTERPDNGVVLVKGDDERVAIESAFAAVPLPKLAAA